MRLGPFPPWNHPAADLRLIPSEVHVWRACLDPPAAGSQDFTPLLSREEQERAEAFLLPRDRLRFRAGRGLLRILLGRYLKIGPQELEFSYGPHGKPEIGASLKRRKIEFNLSHAGGHLLVAVALGRRVGVDIERISSEPERVEIADRFFAPVERAALEALPETGSCENLRLTISFRSIPANRVFVLAYRHHIRRGSW